MDTSAAKHASHMPFAQGGMYHAHPGIAHLCAVIRSGELGPLRHLCCWFGLVASDAVQTGGAIGEVGGYPLSLAMLLAGAAAGGGWAQPESMRCFRRESESGADLASHAQLRFAGGLTADLSCALDTDWDMGVNLIFAQGIIRVTDPFWPEGRAMHIQTLSEVAPPRNQVITAAESFNAAAQNTATHAETLAVARWLEAWRTQACDAAATFAPPPVHP